MIARRNRLAVRESPTFHERLPKRRDSGPAKFDRRLSPPLEGFSDIRGTDERDFGIEYGKFPMVPKLKLSKGLVGSEKMSSNSEPKRISKKVTRPSECANPHTPREERAKVFVPPMVGTDRIDDDSNFHSSFGRRT